MKLKDKLQSMFSKTKVQKQLYAIFFAAILIPVTVIGILLLLNTQKLLTNHYENQIESDNLRIKSIMFDITTNIYNQSEDLAFDTNLQKLLSTSYASPVESRTACGNYKRILSILKNETSVADLKVYTLNETIEDYDRILFATEAIRETDWFQKASGQSNIFWKVKKQTDHFSNDYYELTLYRKIPLPDTKSYAVLEMTTSSNYLKNRIENNTLTTILSVNQEPVFYSSNRSFVGLPLGVEVDYSKGFYQYLGRNELNGTKVLSAVSTLTPYQSDDILYLTSLNFQAYPYINKVTLTYGIIILLILFVPTGIIYIFTRYFSARVGVLRSAMHQASNGDYNIIDSFQGDDELSEAFQDLKVMIEKIKDNEAQMYEAQIKEQEITNRQQQMEFKMLASQINPHFLYNTLETIRMKSLTAGNREVATAIKLLGKSMRYVLENTGTASTTLKKEMDYIETYLSIQKLRFHERVNYQIQIEPETDISEYQILPLLLQPIVENAILHGLEGVEENGQIIIHIWTKDDEYLCIDIFDNGEGMTAEELEKMISNMNNHDKASADSIGLYNINQRIKLCYGTSYGLTVKSRKTEGTLVSLQLPLTTNRGKDL